MSPEWPEVRLSLRFAIIFGLGALVSVASIAFATSVLARTEVVGAFDDALEVRADRIVSLSSTEVWSQPLSSEVERAFKDAYEASGTGVAAYSPTGEYVSGQLDIADGAYVSLALMTDDRLTATYESEGRSYRLLSIRSTEINGVPAEYVGLVVLYMDVTSQEAGLDNLRARLAAIAGGAFVALALAGGLVGRWIAGPLDEVTAAAEDLSRLEDLPRRIELSRGGEVGRLAKAFNRLLSALEVAREQQRRLVADASHELRTPLASLRMRIEFLAGTQDLPMPQRQAMLGAAVADLERLSALVAELVDLATDVRGEEDPQLVPLKAILDEVAERTAAGSLRPITVNADSTTARVRSDMVKRAVQNLVDNAVKYSPEGTPIELRMRTGAIEVIDQGSGIVEEYRALVFDRFYRSPRARSRPGSGIGLAIVKQVADVHNGDVWVSDAPDGGARVGFSVEVKEV